MASALLLSCGRTGPIPSELINLEESLANSSIAKDIIKAQKQQGYPEYDKEFKLFNEDYKLHTYYVYLNIDFWNSNNIYPDLLSARFSQKQARTLALEIQRLSKQVQCPEGIPISDWSDIRFYVAPYGEFVKEYDAEQYEENNLFTDKLQQSPVIKKILQYHKNAGYPRYYTNIFIERDGNRKSNSTLMFWDDPNVDAKNYAKYTQKEASAIAYEMQRISQELHYPRKIVIKDKSGFERFYIAPYGKNVKESHAEQYRQNSLLTEKLSQSSAIKKILQRHKNTGYPSYYPDSHIYIERNGNSKNSVTLLFWNNPDVISKYYVKYTQEEARIVAQEIQRLSRKLNYPQEIMIKGIYSRAPFSNSDRFRIAPYGESLKEYGNW